MQISVLIQERFAVKSGYIDLSTLYKARVFFIFCLTGIFLKMLGRGGEIKIKKKVPNMSSRDPKTNKIQKTEIFFFLF
jgi:hypothetical protein